MDLICPGLGCRGRYRRRSTVTRPPSPSPQQGSHSMDSTACSPMCAWTTRRRYTPTPKFLLQVPILATTFLLCEEIGFRGYLLPKLLPMGRKRPLLLSGLIFATWHMPLVFLTPLLPIGNPVISVPLFYAAVVAGTFFYGYLRLPP